MDEAVIKYYRTLLRAGFKYAGSLENPTIFLDSIGENLPICGKMGKDYLHLFINMEGEIINDIKYLCTCDPTANVVFEILCLLVKGKTISEVRLLNENSFSSVLNSHGEEFLKKARGSLELINRGFTRYQCLMSTNT